MLKSHVKDPDPELHKFVAGSGKKIIKNPQHWFRYMVGTGT